MWLTYSRTSIKLENTLFLLSHWYYDWLGGEQDSYGSKERGSHWKESCGCWGIAKPTPEATNALWPTTKRHSSIESEIMNGILYYADFPVS